MDAELRSILMKKAGAILARRACSRGELRNRLAKIAGETPVEEVLDRLEQVNLLNDREYAYNFALHRIRQEGWGPAKVLDSLLRRHVEPEIAESALKRVRDEVDPSSILADYARKYFGKSAPDAKRVRKMIAHLHRRGFAEDSILDALRRVVPAALMQRYETGE